jgi:hypothetical protein
MRGKGDAPRWRCERIEGQNDDTGNCTTQPDVDFCGQCGMPLVKPLGVVWRRGGGVGRNGEPLAYGVVLHQPCAERYFLFLHAADEHEAARR